MRVPAILAERLYLLRDCAQHDQRRAQDVVVPESQHGESSRRKEVFPSGIMPEAFVRVVLAAVQFDDEIKVEAGEICEVRTDRVLSPEPKVHEPPASEVEPDQPLGVRLVASQGASEGALIVR